MDSVRIAAPHSTPRLWIVLTLLVASVPFLMNVSTGSAQSATATVIAGEGADPADVELVRESIVLAETMFASVLGAQIERPLSVIVRPSEADRVETFGMYNDGVIEIFTASRGWTARSDLERVKGVLHEYAHFYLDPAPHPKRRPVWLEEGMAEFLAWRLLDEIDLADHSEILAYHAAHIRIWPTGSLLCSVTPIAISGVMYPLVHLGAAVLLQDLSLAALVDYRDSMARGVAHDAAFASAFRRSEADFCADVDRDIEALPPAVSMPNDIFIREAAAAGTFADFIDVPHVGVPGEQLIVKARTDQNAACGLSLTLSTSPDPTLTQSSRADGDGDVFWLVTIPSNSVSGPGKWSLACGTGSDESPMTVTLRRESIDR